MPVGVTYARLRGMIGIDDTQYNETNSCVTLAMNGGNQNAGRLNYTLLIDGYTMLSGKTWSLGETTEVDIDITNNSTVTIVITPISTFACDQLVFVRYQLYY